MDEYSENIARITKPPKPVESNIFIQVEWMFLQVASEKDERTGKQYIYASNKYIAYLEDTRGSDVLFMLSELWKPDALILFSDWLIKTSLASNTKYSLYKSVRTVMDMAYVYDVINMPVMHPPMPPGVRETDERTAYNEEQQYMIGAVLAKAVRFALLVSKPYERTNLGKKVKEIEYITKLTVNGNTYPDCQEAAKEFNVKPSNIFQRLKRGWSPEEAVGLVKRKQDLDKRISSRAIELTIDGTTFKSLTQASNHYGISRVSLSSRLKSGWSPEEAVGLAPCHDKREKYACEDSLRWHFENEFNCNIARALTNKRFLNAVVTTFGTLEKLYAAWNVYPRIDKHLIYPLVAQLAAYTALNVESLCSLTIDVFKPSHPLTGQPYLDYKKKRSASPWRPDKKELHLSLLDIKSLEDDSSPERQLNNETDAHFLDIKISKKVEKIIKCIIELTNTLRTDPRCSEDIKDKLVITENTIKNKEHEELQIFAMDSEKLGKWYKYFVKRYKLYDKKGKLIQFNLSKFRPTVATNMVMNGSDLQEVSAILSHGSVVVTMKYMDSHNINPAFHKEMTRTLGNIKDRSEKQQQNPFPVAVTSNASAEDSIYETLSGCFCKNPLNPDASIRKKTKFQEGSICKYWNMCLLCDKSLVTKNSLPKIITYRSRIEIALTTGADKVLGKGALLKSIATLIDGVLEPDYIFSADVIYKAREISEQADDVLLDQLVYQGMV